LPVPEEFQKHKTDVFADDFEQEDHDSVARLQALQNRGRRDRQVEAQARLNEKVQCQACGSTWFTEETFNQYHAGSYGSSPGSDLQILSTMPMVIKVCLCGMPQRANLGGAVRSGRTPNENIESFDGSLENAIIFRTQRTDEKMTQVARNLISQAMGVLASKHELNELAQLVAAATGAPAEIPAERATEQPDRNPEPEPVRPSKKK
jgi:hypothetical protein